MFVRGLFFSRCFPPHLASFDFILPLHAITTRNLKIKWSQFRDHQCRITRCGGGKVNFAPFMMFEESKQIKKKLMQEELIEVSLLNGDQKRKHPFALKFTHLLRACSSLPQISSFGEEQHSSVFILAPLS